MRKYFTCIASALFLFSFGITQSFAASVGFVNDIATTHVTLGASDSVTATIEVTGVTKDYPYSKAYTWGGDEDSPPKRIIKDVSVMRNGRSIYIPLSAYADLGDPSQILLEKLSSKRFRLVINGGDAAGSYSAMLDFSGNKIYSKKVVSNEFPKHVWEKTIFSFNDLIN